MSSGNCDYITSPMLVIIQGELLYTVINKREELKAAIQVYKWINIFWFIILAPIMIE